MLYSGPGTGLELLGKQAFSSLFASLNTELNNVSEHYVTLDQELATLRSVAYATVPLETINNDNFHLGHKPSLIDAPIYQYPNVSVMAYQSQPSPEQPDQFDQSIGSLFIELMVKATESEGEELINKRIQRTTDAAIEILRKDPDLNGNFDLLKRPPNITIYNVFVRKKERGQGEKFLFQEARIDFSFDLLAELNKQW